MNDLVTIICPMGFTKEDIIRNPIGSPEWEALKKALLDGIRESYEYALNEEIKKRGWDRVTSI